MCTVKRLDDSFRAYATPTFSKLPPKSTTTASEPLSIKKLSSHEVVSERSLVIGIPSIVSIKAPPVPSLKASHSSASIISSVIKSYPTSPPNSAASASLECPPRDYFTAPPFISSDPLGDYILVGENCNAFPNQTLSRFAFSALLGSLQAEPLQSQLEECAAYCNSLGNVCGSFSFTTWENSQTCTVYYPWAMEYVLITSRYPGQRYNSSCGDETVPCGDGIVYNR